MCLTLSVGVLCYERNVAAQLIPTLESGTKINMRGCEMKHISVAKFVLFLSCKKTGKFFFVMALIKLGKKYLSLVKLVSIPGFYIYNWTTLHLTICIQC